MSSTDNDILSKLQAPFPRTRVKWRRVDSENGRALLVPYLDARDVQDRLDEALGPMNWRNEFSAGGVPGTVLCAIAIRMGEQWVSKQDGAHVDKADGNRSNDRELALKGAYTEAFKRAAVMWGVGRYLYRVPATWVPLDANGRLTEAPVLADEFAPADEAGQRTTGALDARDTPRVEAAVAPAEANTVESAPSAAESDEKPTVAVKADEPKAVEPQAEKPRTTEPAVAQASVAAAPKVEETKTAEPAAAPTDDAPFDVEQLTPAQRTYYDNFVARVQAKATPVKMLLNFVNSEKAREKLPLNALAHLRERINATTEAA